MLTQTKTNASLMARRHAALPRGLAKALKYLSAMPRGPKSGMSKAAVTSILPAASP